MPAYTVRFLPSAEGDLDDIPTPMYERIRSVIHSLADEPRPMSAIKMSGNRDRYRVRAGGFRIVYEIRDKALLVLVIGVAKRDKIYSIIKRR